ncbi:leucyl/phenylalanyl-tRNA--protein transferase [Actinopolyspora xinjiangensis]|uniref:Leucyl/phenylalanyl-tRNA--protein transferase n=1 Tax=Actinopolyspora xinjiangensis TaxID=405564 RepID=A0A1H0S5D9_9ACTN|nr:leucyl/phenylalanyl-tRNA--protein transferase [Actinopolyspora xinjiangensis]SDP36857.1 leucyl/phenylalanyl-tRNA--protein transferase [Actinopolyspora xinjiangensis]
MTNTVSSRSESPWSTVDLTDAPSDGPVAFGGDLRPHNLLAAYRRGLYPFPAETVEHRLFNEMSYESDVATGRVKLVPGAEEPYSLAWCSPDPRPLIPVTRARVRRSLRQQLRRTTNWTTTVDVRFEEVATRSREGRERQWLTDELLNGLCRLHEDGHAHSVEVWDGAELIGGTFGVRVGAVFSADSQFTRRSGAGKVAVTDLTRRFAEAGGTAVDVQYDSEHARLLGARPTPRPRYLELLRSTTEGAAVPTGALPAHRLAD